MNFIHANLHSGWELFHEEQSILSFLSSSASESASDAASASASASAASAGGECTGWPKAIQWFYNCLL